MNQPNVIVEEDNVGKVDNKLELIKYSSQVQSRIKNDITSDFILAKLGEEDKKAVIEMVSNAYLAKKIAMQAKERATQYTWKEGYAHKRRLTLQQLDYVQKVSERIFDSYLTRIYMVANLNRNVDKNHLLNILAGTQNETKELEEPEQERENLLKKIKKKQKKQEQEED